MNNTSLSLGSEHVPQCYRAGRLGSGRGLIGNAPVYIFQQSQPSVSRYRADAIWIIVHQDKQDAQRHHKAVATPQPVGRSMVLL